MSERTGGASPADGDSPASPPPPPSWGSAPSSGSAADVNLAQPIVIGNGPFNLAEDAEAQATRKKTHTRKMIMIGLLAVTVAGAAVIAVAGWRVLTQKDATITALPQIGTLTIDESEDGRATADYLTTALAAEVDLKDQVGAIYQDSAEPQKSVLFFGGTGLIWSPAADLEGAFDLIADDQGAVTNVREVDAGPLGGTMKCGATATAEGDLTVCGWSDHGSLAVALFPGRTADESAALLREIRAAAQSRQ